MKNRKEVYSVRLSTAMANTLAELSELTGKPKSWFIVKGLEHYLNRNYVKQKLEGSDAD